MNSRPLMEGKKLRMFIDTESFSYLLEEKNILAEKILNWANSKYTPAKYLEFARSSFVTEYVQLNNIKPFEFELDDNLDRQKF